MRRKLGAGFALIALAIVASPLSARADQTVTIGPAFSFNPATLTIVPGETVTWTWAAGGHSTTSDATSGPEVWDSGVQSLGFSFSHVFTTPGTFPYYCKAHSFPGGTFMNGVVQVVVPTVTPTATVTAAPSVTPLPAPSPTAPRGGAPAGAIPALDERGLAVLAGALAVASLALLARSRR